MKIAILADPLDVQYAGIKTYTKSLIEELSTKDRKNEYFVFRPSDKNEFEFAREIQIEISKFPFHSRLRQFSVIPRMLKKHEIDIAIEPAHFGPYNLPKHIKRITVIHDLSPILFKQFHNQASYLAHKYVLPRGLNRTDKIVAVSKNTKNDIQKLFQIEESKISIIPNFLAQKKGAIVQILPSIKKQFFLIVGTIEPRKKHIESIKAFVEFKQQTQSRTQLIIIGKDGWKSEEFKLTLENIEFKEDIIWMKDVSNEKLSYYYQNALCLIFNSFYEGFGYPILEAMQFSCPVIAANNSSIPEVLGNGGLLFDNVQELTKLLIDIDQMKDLKSFKQLSKKRFNEFSAQNIVGLWQNLFAELINK